MLAALATGEVPDTTTWNSIMYEVYPDPDKHSLYDQYFTRMRGLYHSTQDICHFLSEQQAHVQRERGGIDRRPGYDR